MIRYLKEEKKEISEKDIKDIVEVAMEQGSFNFNPDLYSPEELYEITLAVDKATRNLKTCNGRIMSILRSRDRKLANKAYRTVRGIEK